MGLEPDNLSRCALREQELNHLPSPKGAYLPLVVEA
jgi:hypothetical protein